MGRRTSLTIKELLIHGNRDRCLIVAPGNLVEQWQDELAEKIGSPLQSSDSLPSRNTGRRNPFAERNRLTIRLDMAARELFEGQALRDLLVNAIRYGDRPETKAELFRKVDGVVDVATIERLVAERKLTSEGMDPNAVSAIREEMGLSFRPRPRCR